MDNIRNNNPFNLSFGKQPPETISRSSEMLQIISEFDSSNPESQVYILTGLRGVGKTVMLSMLEDNYRKEKDWIVVDLIPETEMLEQLASLLYDEGRTRHLFLEADFSFSFKGLTFSISGKNPVENVMTILKKMFEYLAKKGKKVFIGIDEASNSSYMKVFCLAFQQFYRLGYPIYLVMTGLQQNISLLQNEKALTFLHRAPKICLSPLNENDIALSYQQALGSDAKTSIRLARLTKGYAFAYQVLGYLLYRHNLKDINEAALKEYDSLLADRSYKKIWSELPSREKEVCKAIALKGQTNEEIMKATGLTKNALSVYKERLSDRGITDTSNRGITVFTLPRFAEFVASQPEPVRAEND